MSNDFTRYPFGDKTIRVSYDAQEKKHWFVIEDVMCVFFANGETFWEGLKNVMTAEGLSSPEAYVAYQTSKDTIDVADLQQMMNIIAYVPKRTRKKEMVAYWLYNHKESDEKAQNVTLKPFEQEIISQIHQTESEIKAQKEDENESVLWATIFLITTFFLHFLYTTYYDNEILIHLLFVVVEFNFYIVRKKRIQKIEESNNNSNNQPAPKAITDKILSILRERVITYNEKEAIVEEAIKLGAKQSFINKYITTAIREAIKIHKKSELTRCVKCLEPIPDDIEQCPFCGDYQIWTKIHKLTALALSDRVLTDLERKSIVNKAVELGISSEEINQYLDEQLNLRLKYYTKVDLRDCPYCGAQIPLISDECMYCGKPLENIDYKQIKPIKIISEEAEIIRSENQKVEEKRHGIRNCPDCGAPFPLISNICPSCGHVLHERYENQFNIQNLLKNIEDSIHSAATAEKTSARGITSDYLHIFILIISLFSLYMGNTFHNSFFQVIPMLGCVFFIIIFIVNITSPKSSEMKGNEEYYKAIYTYEMYLRQVKTLYGNDPEAKPLLNRFADIIKNLKEYRRKNRYKVASKIAILIVVAFGIISFVCVNTFLQQKTKTWSIPVETPEVYKITKKLKPYPFEKGVENQLDNYLIANKDAKLSFVLTENNQFRWKIKRIELGTFPNKNYDSLFRNKKLHIVLLRSNFTKITEFSKCINNFGHHPLGWFDDNKLLVVDFWSEETSSLIEDLETIANSAEYYTIVLTDGR